MRTTNRCRYIGDMPRLRFLGCQDTVAGDDGFVALSRSQIDRVHLGTAVPQSSRPRLRRAIDDAGLASAVGELPECRRRRGRELAELPALSELMPMDIPDAGYRHIARASSSSRSSSCTVARRPTPRPSTSRDDDAQEVLRELHADHRSHAGVAGRDLVARRHPAHRVRRSSQTRASSHWLGFPASGSSCSTDSECDADIGSLSAACPGDGIRSTCPKALIREVAEGAEDRGGERLVGESVK